MFDVRWIRDHPEAFDTGLARRGLAPLSSEIVTLDAKRRGTQTELQELQTQRNEASKRIGIAKKNGEDATELITEVADLKERIQALDDDLKQSDAAVENALQVIPNIPSPEVPDGADELANVELRRIGEKPELGYPTKEHHELGEALSMMDFQRAGKLSGARFVVLSGALARLERALGQFMIDLQTTEHGYVEVTPPTLVRDTALFGTGQLPKFGGDLFRTTSDHWLIPTAEVPLTNLVADEILDESALPIRFTALTPCFRSEAGAAGKDTHGMMRQHQFSKVELVSIVRPDDSEDEHERMTAAAEEVLKRLDLHYRVVVLSTGDLGFSARRLPGTSYARQISTRRQ